MRSSLTPARLSLVLLLVLPSLGYLLLDDRPAPPHLFRHRIPPPLLHAGRRRRPPQEPLIPPSPLSQSNPRPEALPTTPSSLISTASMWNTCEPTCAASVCRLPSMTT